MSTPAGLEAAAVRLDRAAGVLAAAGRALDDAGVWRTWRGVSATAAHRARVELRRGADLLAQDVAAVTASLREAAVAAVATGTAEVTAAGAATAGATATGAAAGRAAAREMTAALDRRLAARLDAAGHGEGAGPRSPAATAVPTGPPSLEPEVVAAWWSGLDEPTRAMLRSTRPDLVGGLGGIPAGDRDAANRLRLGAARDAAETERRALLAGAPAAAANPVALAALGVRLSEVGERLERLTAVADAAGAPGRALLDLDTRGGAVRAAIAQGDVDTARNIGVFTPGFTADVRDVPDRLDTLGRVGRLAGPDTAMVAWYDYDAPQWTGVTGATSVTSDASARAGAPRLARFLRGLDAARGSDAHITAVGHSYGSVTTALAVDQAPGVDDAVYLGSPGLDGGSTHVPSWVAEAADDPVADAGWFGPDPNRAPGAVGLSTREVVLPDGRVLAGSSGHQHYLDAGTTSEHNVAAVVGNRSSDAVLDRGVGAGDRLRGLFGG